MMAALLTTWAIWFLPLDRFLKAYFRLSWTKAIFILPYNRKTGSEVAEYECMYPKKGD